MYTLAQYTKQTENDFSQLPELRCYYNPRTNCNLTPMIINAPALPLLNKIFTGQIRDQL